jgi:hypothetical protein
VIGCFYTLSLYKIYQKKILRRISGPKRDAETGVQKKLYNEELHHLFSSTNTVL